MMGVLPIEDRRQEQKTLTASDVPYGTVVQLGTLPKGLICQVIYSPGYGRALVCVSSGEVQDGINPRVAVVRPVKAKLVIED